MGDCVLEQRMAGCVTSCESTYPVAFGQFISIAPNVVMSAEIVNAFDI